MASNPEWWKKYQTPSAAQPAPQAPTRGPILGPSDPYKAASEGRAQVDQNIQISSDQRDAARDAQTSVLNDYLIREKEAKLKEEEDKKKRFKDAEGGAVAQLTRVIDSLDRVYADSADNGGWGETGTTGNIMRDYTPGAWQNPARDLDEAVKNIDANLAFDALQNMRDNSPTGGALGGIAVEELNLLKSSVANISPRQSQQQFVQQVGQAKAAYLDMLERIDPAKAKEIRERGNAQMGEGGIITYDQRGADLLKGISGGDSSPPAAPAAGDTGFMEGAADQFGQGTRALINGITSLPELAINPVGQAFYSLMGYDQPYDAGQVVSDAVGLPQGDPNSLAWKVNEFGGGALAGGALARVVSPLLTQGSTAQNVAQTIGRTPIRDTVAGAGAGAGAYAGKESGIPGGEIGGALLGGMAGFAGASAAAPSAMRVSGVGAPRAINNPVMQAADRQNISMLPADVGGTGTRMASGVTANTLGGIPMADAAETSIQSAANARNRVAGDIGNFTDDVGAGQAVKRGVNSFIDSSDKRGGQLFERVSVPREQSVTLDNTRQAITSLTEGFKSNPELSRIWTGNPRLRETLDALTPKDVAADGRRAFMEAADTLTQAQENYRRVTNAVSSPAEQVAAREQVAAASQAVVRAQREASRAPVGGDLSWEDMKRFRSIIGEIVGKPAMTSDGSDVAAMRNLYGALSRDMENTARATSPKALKEFQRANQYWRGREDRIETVFKELLGNEQNRGDRAVYERLNSWANNRGDVGRLSRAMRSLPKDEADTVRATLVQRMGTATPARQNPDGLEFSPTEYAKQWMTLHPRAKAVLFPNKQHRQDLDDLATVMDTMKRAGEYNNVSKTAIGVNAVGQTALAMTSLPAAIGLAGVQFGAGKLLSSPKFARYLASSIKLPPEQQARRLTQQLGVLAKSEPLLAQEVNQFLRAMNDNYSAVGAAASNEREGQK